jgi:hypothetical protein
MINAKRTATRVIRRTRAADMRRAAQAEVARRLEASDEAIAPAIQRNAVLDASGAVIRAARVQRDGVTFSRADPLKHLADIAERGGMFSAAHIAAARRLVVAWDAVGDGVGLGASDWGSLRGTRGTAPMTPAGHSSLVAQVEQRIEIEAAWTWLGGLWSCLENVVLRGMSLSAWGVKADIGRNAAPGFLLAALVRLVEFYKQRDAVPERRGRMRSVDVVRAA